MGFIVLVFRFCTHLDGPTQAVGRGLNHVVSFCFVRSNRCESGDEENYRGSAKAKTGREGPPRRRLLSTATTANSIAKQQQHETAGGEPKARAGAGIAERESRTPQAVAGERSKSKSTVLRTVNGERPSEAALEEADGRAAQIQGVETIDAGEDYDIMDGVVEPVEGGGAEEDKGIEEGEAEGFVVEARDDKVRERQVCLT